MGQPAVEHVGLRHTAAHGVQAGLHLGDHAAGQPRQQPFQAGRGQQADHGPGLVRAVPVGRPVRMQARHVGEHHELGRAEGHGQRRGGGVGVDVVHLAAGAPRDAGHHRDPAVGDQGARRGGIHGLDLADQADVHRDAVHHGVPLARDEHVRVLARHAHGVRPVLVDQADHLPADLAGEHHAHHVHGFRRGDPQSRGERAVQAEPGQVRGDLRPAPVHHDRAEPGVPQEHHVLGEGTAQRVVGHHMAAVLDDDGLAVERVQPGQRLDERSGLGHRRLRPANPGSGFAHRRGHVGYAEFSWTYSVVRSVVRMVAAAGPADRSTVIVTSRGLRSTLDLSSAPQPLRHTHTPLTATLTRSGSNAASVVPTADSTRPQFGSAPAMAHLSSADLATARPTVTASASLAAPTTSIAISLPAPSASAWSCRARSAQTSVSTPVNSPMLGRTPDAPLASSSTVSLVDMQPSVSSRSKVTLVAARSAASRVPASRSASVLSTQSMVASAGASMPAPLAMPPIVYPSGRWNAILATVSVVLIASAAARPPDREASATAASAPASRRSMGRRSPIRPVEQTAISPAESASRSARRSALEWVSVKPSGPVQALAPPELSRTARTLPPRTTCWVHSTGAAFTRLAVNTPAAARDGPSLITTATSRPPDALIPAAAPAARNPSGAVTLNSLPPSRAVGPGGLPGFGRQVRGVPGGRLPGQHSIGAGTAWQLQRSARRLRRACSRSVQEVLHGASPCAVRPAVSGRPSIRLAAWIAWPAAPLPRLSRAATTTARPAWLSAAACRYTAFEPSAAAVVGQRSSGSRCTNGSPA